MRSIFAILTVVFITNAVADNNNALGDIFFSDDSDGVTHQKFRIGYGRDVTDDTMIGVKVGSWDIHEPIGGDHSFQTTTLFIDSDITDTIHLSGELIQLDGSVWSPTTTSGLLTISTIPRWHFEVGFENGIVDSVAGINAHLSTNNYSASADYMITTEVVAVGTFLQSSVSDGNSGTGAIGRLVYSPKKLLGWNFQLKLVNVKNDFDGNEYFAPVNKTQQVIYVGYVTGFADDTWLFRSHFGTGQQTINDGSGESMVDYKLSIAGNFTDNFEAEVYYGCTSDGGEYDYEYCYGGASGLYRF